jgi:hypothetical protein
MLTKKGKKKGQVPLLYRTVLTVLPIALTLEIYRFTNRG